MKRLLPLLLLLAGCQSEHSRSSQKVIVSNRLSEDGSRTFWLPNTANEDLHPPSCHRDNWHDFLFLITLNIV